MSVKNRNTLKSEFVSGTAATSEKFENLIDSAYNRYEDSILLGPLGITGSYGLIGPSGGTYNGLIGPSGSTHYTGLFISISGTAPTGPTSSGNAGEVYFETNGSTSYIYVYNGSIWHKISSTVSW